MHHASHRVSRVLVLGLLLLGSAPRTAFAATTFENELAAAVRYYEDLEYERALKQLGLAQRRARTRPQRTRVALLRGILLAEMGRWSAARSAFRSALRLDPDATLPLTVPPKVERTFESVRAAVLKAQRRNKPSASPPEEAPPPVVVQAPDEPVAFSELVVSAEPTPSPAFEPASESSSEPSSVAVASDRPEQPRQPVLTPEPPPPSLFQEPVVEAPRGRPVTVPLVLLGAGVAAAGAGSYFGLASRGQVNDARAALYQDEANAHLEDARGNARLANILFGTAGLAATSALLTYLLMPGDSAPAAEDSP